MDHPKANRRHHLEQLAGLIRGGQRHVAARAIDIGARRGKSVAQVVLRWLVQRGVVVIPKSVRRERMAQNCEVFDFTLDPGEMKAIEKLDTGASLFRDHRDPATVRWLGELRLADACVHVNGRNNGWRRSAMSNAISAKSRKAGMLAMALGLGMAAALGHATQDAQKPQGMTSAQPASETLSARQQAIVPIAAFAAAGDISRLGTALNQGLDAGLTVSDAREVLVQLYAYAGFPRSLNALAELMKVLEARKQRGIQDAPGRAPSRAIPKGEALLAAGTVNQTKLTGVPVRGPLFDFAPAIDEYLKTHLFGDIFERDNLDWQSRELATVSMLSALPGAESQLQSHMRVSMNVGLTASQLRQLTQVLAERVDADNARRAREALERQLATKSGG